MRPDLTKAQLIEGPKQTVVGEGGAETEIDALPITAAELRAHLWTIYPEKTTDAYLELLIKAATSHIETVTWRRLITQEWRIYIDKWPVGGIHLPFGHIQSIESVKWLDVDAVDNELSSSDYIPAIVGPEPMVMPSASGWPSGQLYDVDPIRVDFICGFGDTGADVPADLRHAIQLLAAHWYETREAVIVGTTVRKVPFAVDALIAPWKVRRA